MADSKVEVQALKNVSADFSTQARLYAQMLERRDEYIRRREERFLALKKLREQYDAQKAKVYQGVTSGMYAADRRAAQADLDSLRDAYTTMANGYKNESTRRFTDLVALAPRGAAERNRYLWTYLLDNQDQDDPSLPFIVERVRTTVGEPDAALMASRHSDLDQLQQEAARIAGVKLTMEQRLGPNGDLRQSAETGQLNVDALNQVMAAMPTGKGLPEFDETLAADSVLLSYNSDLSAVRGQMGIGESAGPSDPEMTAELVANPRFRQWALESGLEVGTVRTDADGKPIMATYRPGRDDLKAVKFASWQSKRPTGQLINAGVFASKEYGPSGIHLVVGGAPDVETFGLDTDGTIYVKNASGVFKEEDGKLVSAVAPEGLGFRPMKRADGRYATAVDFNQPLTPAEPPPVGEGGVDVYGKSLPKRAGDPEGMQRVLTHGGVREFMRQPDGTYLEMEPTRLHEGEEDTRTAFVDDTMKQPGQGWLSRMAGNLAERKFQRKFQAGPHGGAEGLPATAGVPVRGEGAGPVIKRAGPAVWGEGPKLPDLEDRPLAIPVASSKGEPPRDVGEVERPISAAAAVSTEGPTAGAGEAGPVLGPEPPPESGFIPEQQAQIDALKASSEPFRTDRPSLTPPSPRQAAVRGLRERLTGATEQARAAYEEARRQDGGLLPSALRGVGAGIEGLDLTPQEQVNAAQLAADLAGGGGAAARSRLTGEVLGLGPGGLEAAVPAVAATRGAQVTGEAIRPAVQQGVRAAGSTLAEVGRAAADERAVEPIDASMYDRPTPWEKDGRWYYYAADGNIQSYQDPEGGQSIGLPQGRVEPGSAQWVSPTSVADTEVGYDASRAGSPLGILTPEEARRARRDRIERDLVRRNTATASEK